MRNHLISILSVSCGALLMLYITLIGTTIFFASWQTETMNTVRISEGQMGNMEANYYSAMNHASTLNPAILGFVTPSNVQFVASAQDTGVGLSFAGR
jgi:hypothetical protein